MAEVLVLIALGLGAWRVKKMRDKYWLNLRNQRNQEALNEFGADPDERDKNIKAFFNSAAGKFSMLVDTKGEWRCRELLERNLASMPGDETLALEIIYRLYNAGHCNEWDFFLARLALAYGDGQGMYGRHADYVALGIKPITLSSEQMQKLVHQYWDVNVRKATNLAFNMLTAAHRENPDDPLLKELMEELDAN